MLEKFKVNAAMVRIIYVLVGAAFSIHFMACMWFLAAKLDDFNPDTWVMRLEGVDMMDPPF